jgi:protein-tyrosine phosphatase
MQDPKRILFVCLGNICRSPIAEGVAENILKKRSLDLVVDSAGTSNWHEGEAPCSHSVTVSRQNGVDISKQRSRPVRKEDHKDFDYIVAMDEQNRQDLKALGFSTVYKLGDFGGFEGKDVPDPYFFPGFEGFEKVYNMIDIAMEDFLNQLREESLE